MRIDLQHGLDSQSWAKPFVENLRQLLPVVIFGWAHMMALVEMQSEKWPRNAIPHGEKGEGVKKIK